MKQLLGGIVEVVLMGTISLCVSFDYRYTWQPMAILCGLTWVIYKMVMGYSIQLKILLKLNILTTAYSDIT